MANGTPGEPHGRQNPIRWDASTATCVLVVGALAFLVFVNFNVRGGATASASLSRR